MLFSEIIAVYSDNYTKLINTLLGQNAELLIIKAGGTQSCHWAVKTKFDKVIVIKTKIFSPIAFCYSSVF
jgi:hypothetical protein